MPADPPWRPDPLGFILGDLAPDAFLADCYEQRAVVCSAGCSGHYAGLLGLGRIDELIAHSELPPASLSMARREPPIRRSHYTFSNGNIDRGAVIHHFRHGATLILQQLHRADRALADFCRALEAVFSTRVQTNVYLTPVDSQGFDTHYDDHDVFVLQVSGEKRWRLYRKPVDKPYRGEGFRAADHAPGHPEEEFLLRAGDSVYIPRGLMHDAVTAGSEPSLHITVGLLGRSWADLMLEAVSEVALRDPAFRRSLPPGYSRADFDREPARRQFRDLLERLQRQADFDEVFELMREQYLRGRRPELQGALLAAASAGDGSGSFRLRPGLQVLLRHDGEEAVLVCAGGDIHFPASERAALERVLTGGPFTASCLEQAGSSRARETLAKLLDFGVVAG